MSDKAKCIDFNARDHSGATPFFKACKLNFVEGVKLLLEKAKQFQIDLEVKDKGDAYNCAPFEVAVKLGHIEVVNLIKNMNPERESL